MRREFESEIVRCCPICKSKNYRNIINKYDDRFGQPDIYKYAICKKCNVIFLQDKLTKDSLSRLYSKYYPKQSKVSTKSTLLKKILIKLGLDKLILEKLAGNIVLIDGIRNGSKVLEIGSGYSVELKNVINRKKLDWTGLEVDNILVKQIKKDNLKAISGTVDTLTKLTNDKYDYLILSQSIEHQYDINRLFSNSKNILHKAGKIIFTTPNIDSKYKNKYKERWINWHAPYHTILFSRKAIEALCEKYGYVITKYFTYTPTSWFMLQRIFCIPNKGISNDKFNFNFSLAKQFIVSIYLRLSEIFNRKNGDCIYCEIELVSGQK